MRLLISLILLGMLLEVILFGLPLAWRYRKTVVYILMAIVTFSSVASIVAEPNIFSLLFVVASLYRIFNLLRVVEARMHEGYLRHATRRTAFILLGLQAVVLLIWRGWSRLDSDVTAKHSVLIVLVAIQATIAAVLLASTIRNMIKTRPHQREQLDGGKLPTLSVCIPARNETDDLQECLETVLANDYSKLEILVLDDCSSDKRTPEIIRQFAHDGVEFAQGTVPPEDWLAKNWAYEQLLDKANGDYLLFCGVDVRFSPSSLRKMVSMLLDRRKTMMSIVPERLDSHHLAIIQPMRYWWELVPPRRQFHRPPVLSSCWLAERKALKKAGGFAAATRAIVPEAYFARRFADKDGYSFVRSSDVLGVTTAKPFQEQRATAVRTRYPQLHHRPELVMLLSLIELTILVAPFGLAAGGWWLSSMIIPFLAVIASGLLIAGYEILVTAVMPRNSLLAIVSFPFAVLVDVWLLNYSMYKYEFSTVDWKGRNVCIPAMHVMSSLPKI